MDRFRPHWGRIAAFAVAIALWALIIFAVRSLR
jgi:hypothetical protein